MAEASFGQHVRRVDRLCLCGGIEREHVVLGNRGQGCSHLGFDAETAPDGRFTSLTAKCPCRKFKNTGLTRTVGA